MAAAARDYFVRLTELAQSFLDQVSLNRLDLNPERAIWEVHGSIGEYQLRLKEIFNQSGRLYSYYVIKVGVVVVGFDNYPDRRALREKYGQNFSMHLSELIPHKHGPRKELLELTEEITLETFLDYLNQKNYLQKF